MSTQQTIKLERIKQPVEATDADMSGSSFTDVNLAGAGFYDVNLAGATIHNANLSGASIVDSMTEGMTINGIEVSDLLEAYRVDAYRAAYPKGD